MKSPFKLSKLKKDAAFVYGGYFLRYLSLLILIPYYGRVLGPSSYGMVLAAMSLMAIVWVLVNFGFSITGARELASTHDKDEHSRIFGRQILARIYLLPFGIAAGLIGTALSATLKLNWWFGLLAILIGLLNAFNLGWFFQGLRIFRTSIAVEALAYPLNILFVLCFVKDEQGGIYALLGLLTSNIICTVLAYYLALKQLNWHEIHLTEGWNEIKGASTIFAQSVNSILMTSGSTYLLSVMSTPEQVGLFGASEKLASFAVTLLMPAAQILMPTITRLSTDGFDKALPLVRKAMLAEIAYGLSITSVGLLAAPYVMALAFGHRFGDSIVLFQIIICILPFATFTHAFGLYVLVPKRKEKWLVLAVTCGNLINLGLAFFLVPSMGGKGMALSRVAGEMSSAFFLICVCVGSGVARDLVTWKTPNLR